MGHDLWGELPEFEKFLTPPQILREQAELLTNKTNGLLVGNIKTVSSADLFHVHFSIIAPTLSNFSLKILSVSYPIGLYPAKIVSPITSIRYDVTDEQTFLKAVSEILGSKEIRLDLSNLLTHIAALENEV